MSQQLESFWAVWTSKDVVDVMAKVLTPLVVAWVGWKLSKLGKQIENRQWSDRKIIEKRLEIYDVIVPDLNDLYCYILYKGDWKSKSPEEIISLKRKLDKNVNVYGHLFEEDIINKYNCFIRLCFKTRNGIGLDVKIRAGYATRKEYSTTRRTEEEWNMLFDPVNVNRGEHKMKVSLAYEDLIGHIQKDLGIGSKSTS